VEVTARFPVSARCEVSCPVAERKSGIVENSAGEPEPLDQSTRREGVRASLRW
jgi:hypothetical protein